MRFIIICIFVLSGWSNFSTASDSIKCIASIQEDSSEAPLKIALLPFRYSRGVTLRAESHDLKFTVYKGVPASHNLKYVIESSTNDGFRLVSTHSVEQLSELSTSGYNHSAPVLTASIPARDLSVLLSCNY